MWLFLLGVSLGLGVVGYLGLVRAWRSGLEAFGLEELCRFEERLGEGHDPMPDEVEITKPGFHWRPNTQTGTVPPTGVRMHRRP